MKRIGNRTSREKKTREKMRFFSAQEIAIFRAQLLAWYASNRRHFPWRYDDAPIFHQVVSEVLLQRTKAETVAAFWPIFISHFPNWRSISRAKTQEIEAILKPLGLSKQRAPKLKSLAISIVKNYGRFPASRKEIEELAGVGQYIANAVEIFVHGKRRPLIDVNMARVLERYFKPRKLSDIRYDPYLQKLSHTVVDHPKFRELNWAILDFASLVCIARIPRCIQCPLSHACRYAIQISKKSDIIRSPGKSK